MSIKLTVTDLPNWVGRELGVSQWIKVDQDRIDRFADCTGDSQWIHVDVERARKGPFGSTIGHGYLTASLLAPAAFELLVEPLGAAEIVNYGVDRLRFVAPVRCGSRIRTRMTLKAVEQRPDGRLLLTIDNAVEIEGGEKPALVATTLALLTPA
jgi:acyl dehydratase